MIRMTRRRDAEAAPEQLQGQLRGQLRGQLQGQPATIRAAAAVLFLFTLCAAQPAAASCSKPISPHCSADGSLDDSYVTTSRCKADTQQHLEALEAYRDCLQDLAEETGREIEELKDLLGHPADAPQA